MTKAAALLTLGLAVPVLAQSITVSNPSFESPVLSPGGFTSANAGPGWTVVSGTAAWGVFYPTIASWNYTASHGNQLFYTNGTTVQHVTSHLALANTTYRLCVEVINRPGFGGNNYTIQLYAGSTLLAADNNTLHPPVGGFLTSSIVFTTPASGPAIGQPLTIRFAGASQTNFDNVRLSMGAGACPANPPPACYANCDNSTAAPILNVQDFSCFLNLFSAGDTRANCDASTTPPTLNIADFSCFLNRFSTGCS